VRTKLTPAGCRDFEEIERKRGRYEVKATDQKGQRAELYVDALTGDIVKNERRKQVCCRGAPARRWPLPRRRYGGFAMIPALSAFMAARLSWVLQLGCNPVW